MIERLIQDNGYLKKKDGTPIYGERQVGIITTLTVKNPVVDIETEINDLVARNSIIIPSDANAYVASTFNGDTQFVREEKYISVYALQFYCIPEPRLERKGV